MSPARRQRGGILSFFLVAGVLFTIVGIATFAMGGMAGSIAGGTFALIGIIWVLVALGVGGWYRGVAQKQAEEQQLFQTGERATAVIEGVEATNTMINNQPQVYLTLRVQPRHGEEFIHQRRIVLAFGSVVQPGYLIDVAYDPSNPEKVALDVDERYAATPPAVYLRTRQPGANTAPAPAPGLSGGPVAPGATYGPVTPGAGYGPVASVSFGGGSPASSSPADDSPPTLIEQIERLAKLRDSGALSPEEFETQKRKLLGG
jgi:hypothetical protein